MRALFLLLLLANLLFLAWTQWVAPPREPAGRATPATRDAGSIRLLREAPLARELAAAVRGSGLSEITGDAVTCVSGGPFLERAAANGAVERLGALGFASRVRASRDEVRVGQWVRVESLATPEDAANALVALEAAGLTDATLLAGEPPGNVISLGVFGEPARALEAAAVAQKAGFATVTEDRFRTEDVFWVDVDRQANGGLPGLEVFQGGGGPPSRLELRPCPAAPATPTPAVATPPSAPQSVTPAAPAA